MTTMIGAVIFVSAIRIKNDPLVFILILMILFSSFYFQQFTSRGEVQISISNTSIQIKYLKQPLLSNKVDQNILFNNIESYKYQPDKNFDLFKLTLKDKTELYFYHYSSFVEDDFQKLVLDFPKLAAEYNNHKENISHANATKENNEEIGIKREKTLFEGTTGLLLAGLAIIFIIMFIYLMATKQLKGSSGGFGLLASTSGAIFFLGQYFKYRNKEY